MGRKGEVNELDIKEGGMIRTWRKYASLDRLFQFWEFYEIVSMQLFAPATNAFDPGQIFPALHLGKAVGSGKFAHCGRLIVAVLHE